MRAMYVVEARYEKPDRRLDQSKPLFSLLPHPPLRHRISKVNVLVMIVAS